MGGDSLAASQNADCGAACDVALLLLDVPREVETGIQVLVCVSVSAQFTGAERWRQSACRHHSSCGSPTLRSTSQP